MTMVMMVIMMMMMAVMMMRMIDPFAHARRLDELDDDLQRMIWMTMTSLISHNLQ